MRIDRWAAGSSIYLSGGRAAPAGPEQHEPSAGCFLLPHVVRIWKTEVTVHIPDYDGAERDLPKDQYSSLATTCRGRLEQRPGDIINLSPWRHSVDHRSSKLHPELGRSSTGLIVGLRGDNVRA